MIDQFSVLPDAKLADRPAELCYKINRKRFAPPLRCSHCRPTGNLRGTDLSERTGVHLVHERRTGVKGDIRLVAGGKRVTMKTNAGSGGQLRGDAIALQKNLVIAGLYNL